MKKRKFTMICNNTKNCLNMLCGHIEFHKQNSECVWSCVDGENKCIRRSVYERQTSSNSGKTLLHKKDM